KTPWASLGLEDGHVFTQTVTGEYTKVGRPLAAIAELTRQCRQEQLFYRPVVDKKSGYMARLSEPINAILAQLDRLFIGRAEDNRLLEAVFGRFDNEKTSFLNLVKSAAVNGVRVLNNFSPIHTTHYLGRRDATTPYHMIAVEESSVCS
ncbi:MAG: hypothetical protein KC476_05225, partial [Cyanobacteria bacterium HKST-UBA06]|nr:hypothetical protein [Cyanobacteria bacterium HKST-UBA06]